MTRDDLTDAATKVPTVTLGFWVIKNLPRPSVKRAAIPHR